MNSNPRSAPLNPLRTFAIAAKHSTFTAAAQEMNISQVGVSRQIAILENYLGVKLFERGTSSAKLTEVGRVFGERISPLFVEIEYLTQDLRGLAKETMINIRSYPTFINYWLVPRISDFSEKYPDLDISFDVKVEPLDFRKAHLDFAIQLGNGKWRDCDARVLFPEEIDLICSSDYLERIGGISSPRDLDKATLLFPYYRQRTLFDKWAKVNGVEELNPQHGFHCKESTTAYEAAFNGVGMCMAQLAFVEKPLEQGKLVRPIPTKVETNTQFWVVWPNNRSISPKAKRAIDWLLEMSGQPKHFYQ